jgi:hypothetical protein
MINLKNQTEINGTLIGIIMKEVVRRALVAIRSELHVMEIRGKLDYDGQAGDVVTTCDEVAQAIYVKVLTECFPKFGIIAEEDSLRVACTLEGVDAYFTIDAVDGTKALTRLQSKGIGTMLSLVVDGQVIAAFIGDVMTKEVYGYRPIDDGEVVKVYRISEFEVAKILEINAALQLADQYVLLRERPTDYSPLVQKIIRRPADGGLFKNIQIEGGSIGITMAQLWKSEVGGVILRPAYETPWDSSPIDGISQQMEFHTYSISPDGQVKRIVPVPPKKVLRREDELLIIHQSRRAELAKFLDMPTLNQG